MLPLTVLLIPPAARADTVADWAETTTEIATEGPNTVRTMALAESAVYVAVNAITSRYPRAREDLGATQGASIDAAIAAASREVLLHEAPMRSRQTEDAYAKSLHALPDDEARTLGVNLGVRAAEGVLAKHTDDIGTLESYRPLTTPGVYVPTTFPLGYAFAQHRPWFMKSSSQFRPGPPTALTSESWARDYNEIKAIGSATSAVRTPEQTDIARFWATSLPDIHIRVIRSVADAPSREVTRNARLYAAVAAAMNEAEIAVLEAKYHYQFWRPITAIRNGDQDKNPKTERDPDWAPLIATPLNPEYPCGNCIVGALVAALIRADSGRDPLPTLSTISNTLPGVTRHWTRPEDMVREISDARVYDGVHFRTSTEVANRMGEQIAALIAGIYELGL